MYTKLGFYINLFLFYLLITFQSYQIYHIITASPLKLNDDITFCAKRKMLEAMDSDDLYSKRAMSFVFNSTTVNISKIKLFWNSTLKCLNTSKIYKAPIYDSKNVIAYVYPNIGKWSIYHNRIYIYPKSYKDLDMNQQANTLIHECTHLGFNTYDYAYRWEEKISNLRGKKALYNADSHVALINEITNKCYY